MKSDRVKDSGSPKTDNSQKQGGGKSDNPKLEKGSDSEASGEMNRGTQLPDRSGHGEIGSGGADGANTETKEIDFGHPETDEERQKRWENEQQARNQAIEEDKARLRAAGEG